MYRNTHYRNTHKKQKNINKKLNTHVILLNIDRGKLYNVEGNNKKNKLKSPRLLINEGNRIFYKKFPTELLLVTYTEDLEIINSAKIKKVYYENSDLF